MTITSNLIESFEFTELEEVSNKLNTFFRAFKGHLVAAVPALVGGVVKIVSTIPQIGGIADIGSSLTNATAKAVKEAKNKSMNTADEVLQSDLSYSATMIQFKDKLKELIEKQNSNKPFIVIVDELDRCKPTYAIEFLEKLKHLFDIDNMIFILFINEKELASAISHTYGVNGVEYLEKFIQVSTRFSFKEHVGKNIIRYCNSFFKKDNKDYNGTHVFSQAISDMTSIYGNISYREINNLLKLYNILVPKIGIDSYIMVCFIKIIKQKDTNLYEAFIKPEELKSNYEKIVPVPLQFKKDKFNNSSEHIGVFSLLLYNIHRFNLDAGYGQGMMFLIDDGWLEKRLSQITGKFKTDNSYRDRTYAGYLLDLMMYAELDIHDNP